MGDEEVDSRDRWGLAGAILALCAGALLTVLWLEFDRDIAWRSTYYLALTSLLVFGAATAIVETLRLFGAALGRGLPIPGARFGGALRRTLVLGALIASWMLAREAPIEFAISALTASVVIELISRLRGPGVLWLSIPLAGPELLSELHHRADVPVVEQIFLFATPLAVAGALLIARMRPSRMAVFGLAPCAPSDLVVLPFFTFLAASAFLENRAGVRVPADQAVPVTMEAAIALLEVAAILYLDRRLRVAEARRDAA